MEEPTSNEQSQDSTQRKRMLEDRFENFLNEVESENDRLKTANMDITAKNTELKLQLEAEKNSAATIKTKKWCVICQTEVKKQFLNTNVCSLPCLEAMW